MQPYHHGHSGAQNLLLEDPMFQVLNSVEISQGTEPTQVFILGSFYFGGGDKDTCSTNA